MIILLGYVTPNVDEIPEILYLGNDGVTAQQMSDASLYPRISRLDNPVARPIRNWSEEAADVFKRKARVSDVVTLDQALKFMEQAVAEIEQQRERIQSLEAELQELKQNAMVEDPTQNPGDIESEPKENPDAGSHQEQTELPASGEEGPQLLPQAKPARRK